MAQTSVIGALRVVLGADTATLESDLRKANARLEKFARNTGKIVAGAFVAAAAGLVVAVGRAIKTADELGDVAERFGVPVEELSRLAHVAQLNDVSLEQLGTSLSRLSRGMADAAKGTGPAANAFATLGISVKNADGSLKSASEILPEIADRFSKMEDGTTKAALAQMLFGRTGVTMIEMLNQGADAMRRQMEEADKLGVVVNDRTAAAADNFSKTLIRLGKAFDGIFMQIAQHMLPGLQAAAESMLNFMKETDLAVRVGDTLSQWVVNISALLMRLDTLWQQITTTLTTYAKVVQALIAGDFTGAISAWSTGADKVWQSFSKVNGEIAKMQQAITTVPIGQSMFGEFSLATEGANKATVGLRDLNAEKKIANDADRAWQTTLREANKTIEEARTPLEEYKFRLMEITTQLQQGLITADQWAAAQQKAAERAGISFNALADQTANAFGDIGKAFETFGKQNRDLFEVGKAFGIAEAIVSSYVAFTKALASGVPPFNYIVAAAVLAKGLAAVATIAATQPPGLAMGGSFKVPGGESFTDNKLIPIGLASGERVEVTRDDDRRGRMAEVTLRGVRGRDLFTGDMLRDLFDALNAGHRDGYKLKFA